MNINTVCLKEVSDYGNEVNNNTIHLHKLPSVCILHIYRTPVWSTMLNLQLKRMQQRLILIWHRNSLACLHVFLSLL